MNIGNVLTHTTGVTHYYEYSISPLIYYRGVLTCSIGFTYYMSIGNVLTYTTGVTYYYEYCILIAGNPPSRGGFLFTMFPNQEPDGRGAPSKHLVQILRGGSSSSGCLIREHSR